MGKNIAKRTGNELLRILKDIMGIFTGKNRKKSKEVSKTAKEQVREISKLRKNLEEAEKNLKKDTSENKQISKESSEILTEAGTAKTEENKIKGLKTGVSKDGTITVAGKKEALVIKGDTVTFVNSGKKTKMKPNEMVLPTDHGIYSFFLKEETMAQAKKFGIDIRDVESVKKKAKMLGYDLDNPNDFRKAFNLVSERPIGGPHRITGELVDLTSFEETRVFGKANQNSEINVEQKNTTVSDEKAREKEIDEKRDFNQQARTSYADRLSVFHNQTGFGINPLIGVAAGASNSKVALGSIVQNKMDGILGKAADLKNSDLSKILEALGGKVSENTDSNIKKGRNL